MISFAKSGIDWYNREGAMTRFLGVLVSCLYVGSAFGISPDPKDLAIAQQDLSKARSLVRRLGSEVYREREEAQNELAKMGRLARPALIEALTNDPDPEIRFRCSRLLPKAGADDLKARLETFLADTDCKYEHNLPGLKQFRKISGSDKQARDLYVEIFKSPHNVEMLEMLEKSPAEAGRAVADRRSMLWGLMQQRNMNGRIVQAQAVPLSDIACLLIGETIVPSKEIPRNNMWSYVSGVFFLNQPASQSALRGDGVPHGEIYKRIVAHWMESREDPTEMNQIPDVIGAQLKGFKETLPLLRKVANTEGVMGYAKARALMYLLQQQKAKEELPFVQRFLKNDLVVTSVWFGANPGNPNVPVQLQCLLRDVALAMMITQTNQKMSDYGYTFPQGMIEPNLTTLGWGNYAFQNEQVRAQAMVKFAFWQMKQSPKDPAVTPAAGPKPAPSVPPAK